MENIEMDNEGTNPAMILPYEIFVSILSLVDTQSVLQASLVCKKWHEIAMDEIIWKRKCQSKDADNTFDSDRVACNIVTLVGNERWVDLYKHLSLDMKKSKRGNVIKEGVNASTTDLHSQSVQNTLKDDDNFWSSKGHASGQSDEWLTYSLISGACVITSFRIAAFKASFQKNLPIYSPLQVRLLAGFAYDKWTYESPIFEFEPNTPKVQHFELGTIACGQYVKIELFGKVITQPADDLYYNAIRLVEVIGVPIECLEDSILKRTISRYIESHDVHLKGNDERAHKFVEQRILVEEKSKQLKVLLNENDIVGAIRMISSLSMDSELRSREIWNRIATVSAQQNKDLVKMMNMNCEQMNVAESVVYMKWAVENNVSPKDIKYERLTISEDIGDILSEKFPLQSYRIYISLGVYEKVYILAIKLGKFETLFYSLTTAIDSNRSFEIDFPLILRTITSCYSKTEALKFTLAILQHNSNVFNDEINEFFDLGMTKYDAQNILVVLRAKLVLLEEEEEEKEQEDSMQSEYI